MGACRICGKKIVARGLCGRHLQRLYTWGNPRIVSLSNGELYEEIDNNLTPVGRTMERKARYFKEVKSHG